MFAAIINACKNVINRVKAQLKKITKPATATLAISTITDLPRKKSDLIVENAMLRQQLIVLKRSVKRPKLGIFAYPLEMDHFKIFTRVGKVEKPCF